jgi:tRNA 2-selenouridine synthase
LHAGECVLLDTAPDARIRLLLEDYHHFIDAPETLIARLQVLHPFHGSKQIGHWNGLVHSGEFHTLVLELLELHYDPSYLRSLGKHYTRLDQAQHISLSDLSMDALMPVAKALQENCHVVIDGIRC